MVTSVQVFGHWLAWTGCAHCTASDFPHQVYIDNLQTGKMRLLARSHFRHGRGLLDWTVGTGHFVVWTDMNRVPTDFNGATLWTMHAENLRTGHRWLLDSSHGVPSAAPLPDAGSGKVTWVTIDSNHRTRRILLQNLHTHRTHVLTTHVLAYGSLVSGRTVVYSDNYPPHQPGANLRHPPKRRALYAISLRTRRVWEVGTSHKARLTSFCSGYVTWGEPLYNTQRQVWGIPAHNSRPAQLLYQSGNVETECSSTFLGVWTTGGRLVVIPSHHPGAPLTVAKGRRMWVPAHYSLNGHRLLYAVATHQSSDHPEISLKLLSVRPQN